MQEEGSRGQVDRVDATAITVAARTPPALKGHACEEADTTIPGNISCGSGPSHNA